MKWLIREVARDVVLLTVVVRGDLQVLAARAGQRAAAAA